MQPQDRIYVAGHQGMVGSAIVQHLLALGYSNLICKTHAELDLTCQNEVQEFFRRERPDYVFLAAAKVGGIYANNTYPADFIYDNLMIQNNVINAAYQNKVKRLLFLGSSCIYPKQAPQPMPEACLLTGQLEPTNEPYAIAKIAGIKLCESYNRQHSTDFRSLMPTNLYGQGDNFHPDNSHVLPALLRRFHQAKISNQPQVAVWGSGRPRREFLHVNDMASACIHIMELDKVKLSQAISPMCSHINIGTGQDISIAELAHLIASVVGYQGEIHFDSSKPDGTMQKLLDVSQLTKLGWQAQIALPQGIEQTYDWFLQSAQIRE
jgi:GDP-L-fucose synthase